MASHHYSISSKGQVTIPTYIRENLKINSNSRLEFILQSDHFIVVPINKSVKNLRNVLHKSEVSLTIEQMNDVIADCSSSSNFDSNKL